MPALTIRDGTTLESLNAHGVGHLPGREQLADARLLEHGQLVVGGSVRG